MSVQVSNSRPNKEAELNSSTKGRILSAIRNGYDWGSQAGVMYITCSDEDEYIVHCAIWFTVIARCLCRKLKQTAYEVGADRPRVDCAD